MTEADAAALHEGDLEARARQLPRDGDASGARADDTDIGLDQAVIETARVNEWQCAIPSAQGWAAPACDPAPRATSARRRSVQGQGYARLGVRCPRRYRRPRRS